MRITESMNMCGNKRMKNNIAVLNNGLTIYSEKALAA
jgi:hypothetical protein